MKRSRKKTSTGADLTRYRLSAEDLHWECDPQDFDFSTTRELKPLRTILGQQKALRALMLGLEMPSAGYNIFVCGPPGTGRKTTLRHALKNVARTKAVADDMVYLPRFDVPERPKLITLPAGRAKLLKRDVSKLFASVHQARDRQQEGRRSRHVKKLVESRMPTLLKRYRDRDVLQYLRALARLINARDGELVEDDYGVQILVSRSKGQGPPVLWPTHLTFSGLFGSFEKSRGDDKRPGGIPVGGIRPGALVEASGGFLIVQANEFLEIPHAWSALKSCLMSGNLDLFDSENQSLFNTPNTRPDPIPLDLKVVLIGDYQSYDSLLESDSELSRVFKVRVDFDVEVDRKKSVVARSLPRAVAGICHRENLRHLNRAAVARVVEFAVRRAGRKSKVSIEFSAIADLLREANFWAGRRHRRSIGEAEIKYALRESVDRLNLLETKISEMISDGVILIDTVGVRVGQVNGLAVYDQGDYQFGKPSRITAETSMGREGIINIERESGLSGRSHDKGVQILGGFLRARFAQSRPLSLTASVCFEQSYQGVDGDSASSTEIYAILSSLSGLPIRQDVAVTGSVNQKGDIQPIGGVNEKIEGFFDCVMADKRTGKEGVIIPRRNVPDLMLRDDVVRAVRAGRFTIYAIETVEEGIEILTETKAGKLRKNGTYGLETVFRRVDERLEQLARGMMDHSPFRESVRKDDTSTPLAAR